MERWEVEASDAEEPLPDVETVETLTDEDAQEALTIWNEVMAEYAGLIAASMVGGETGDAWTEDYDSDWYYYYEDEYYTTDEEDEDETERIEGNNFFDVRDIFMEYQNIAVERYARDLTQKRIPLRQFMQRAQRRVLIGNLALFALGRGGLNAITLEDVADIVDNINEQYEFFQTFAQEIYDGELTEAQIRNRAGMYGNSTGFQTDKGRTVSKGLQLPYFPLDGLTDCMMNCRCHWEIQETSTEYLAYWTLGPIKTSHCDTCLGRRAESNPFVQAK